MSCATCGADLASEAVALARSHVACCRSRAFERLLAVCRELVQGVRDLPKGERDPVISDLILRLLRIPVKSPPSSDGAARAYLRRALRNTWLNTTRRPAAMPDAVDPHTVERARRVVEETSPVAEIPSREEVAQALEAHLKSAARRKRGADAQATFVRIMQGLIDQHLRGTRGRADLLSVERVEVNALEKAQERARMNLIEHLLEAAAAHPEALEADRLDQLSLVVEGLKEGGAELARRRADHG